MSNACGYFKFKFPVTRLKILKRFFKKHFGQCQFISHWSSNRNNVIILVACFLEVDAFISWDNLLNCYLVKILEKHSLQTSEKTFVSQAIINQTNNSLSMVWLFFILLGKLSMIACFQKQPPRGVPRKRCSENMQQIYGNTHAEVRFQ